MFLPQEQNKSVRFANSSVLRFARRFAKIKIDKNGHWIWTGEIAKSGYGRCNIKGKRYYVHVVIYCYLKGDYDFESLELDHLCGIRSCCNPDHLEPVSHKENIARSPHKIGRAYRVLKILQKYVTAKG